jgi:hypothetical protein
VIRFTGVTLYFLWFISLHNHNGVVQAHFALSAVAFYVLSNR